MRIHGGQGGIVTTVDTGGPLKIRRHEKGGVMKCCVCDKPFDLNNSGTKVYYLEERETVYGEHSIYQELVERSACCSPHCVNVALTEMEEKP